MDEVPAQLLDGLAPEAIESVASWWIRLTNANRTVVVALYDARQDGCFFGAVPEDPEAPVPVVIGGRFVSNADTSGWAEWHDELFDYLICHPELIYLQPPVIRTFHICTRHLAARAVLAASLIPADFQCPLDAVDCPMRRLLNLAPNQSLQLTSAAGRRSVDQRPTELLCAK